MKCEICHKDVTSVQRFEGKDMCGACVRMIKESRKTQNPKKGDSRAYVEK